MIFKDRELEKRVRMLESRLREMDSNLTGPCSLYERVSKLEEQVTPYRIGPASAYYIFGSSDGRPTVTLREAIRVIMRHLKIQFKHVPSEPARIEVEIAREDSKKSK